MISLKTAIDVIRTPIDAGFPRLKKIFPRLINVFLNNCFCYVYIVFLTGRNRMRTSVPNSSFESITRKSLLAVLYALALYLSVQSPIYNLEQGQNGQFAFEKQNYCLVPIEEQQSRSVNNSIKLLPVIVIPLPEFLNGFKYREMSVDVVTRIKLSTVFFSVEEIIITMRRLRI
jgi:hypothetical protein